MRRALRFLGHAVWAFFALLGTYFIVTYTALYFEQGELEFLITHASIAALALGVAALWMRSEARGGGGGFARGTEIAIRLCLAYMMLWYGSAKLLPGGQFAQPPLVEMDKPYWQHSPFWLAWGFFAHSAAYNAFLAVAELAAGVFIVFDRTKRLAVCLLVPIMANVAIVNYAFKINVLYIALLLLAMSLTLMTKELAWLRASFWSHVPVPPPPAPTHTRAFTWARVVAGVLFVGNMVFILANYPMPEKPALYGIWRVQRTDVATLLGPETRLYVDLDAEAHVRHGAVTKPLELTIDPKTATVTMKAKDGRAFAGKYAVSAGRLLLTAADGGRVELARVY